MSYSYTNLVAISQDVMAAAKIATNKRIARMIMLMVNDLRRNKCPPARASGHIWPGISLLVAVSSSMGNTVVAKERPLNPTHTVSRIDAF
jgi:hypothetical protein